MQEIIAAYRRALEQAPQNAELHLDLGLALEQGGDPGSALPCFCEAVRLRPDFVEAWNILGIALRKRGRWGEAIAAYRRALEIHPAFPECWNNLGVALQQQSDLEQAMAAYQRALDYRPDLAETCVNLANVQRQVGLLEEGVATCRRAIGASPEYPAAWLCLGRIQLDRQQPDQAVESLSRACQLQTDQAENYYYRGLAYEALREPMRSAQDFRRAIELDRGYAAALDGLIHQLQHLCLWSDLADLSRQLIEWVEARDEALIAENHSDLVSPFSFLTLSIPTTAAQQWRCARRWARTISRPPQPLSTGLRAGPQPRRLGYLSSDFHTHATAFLIPELIEAHDRHRWTVYGYSYGPDDHSPIRQRLVHAFDYFVDCRGLSHAQAAARIAADEIDILIDLKGYTQNARPEILAHRPAPIQIQYLGYPGTLGADFVDYAIVDDFVVPPTARPCFSEKLIALPGCYQVNDRHLELPAQPTTRRAQHLPEEGPILCCFNSHYKITPAMFEVWMRILQRVPQSSLWLIAETPLSQDHLRIEAEARGIHPQRLIFAPKLPRPSHLQRQALADLFLDTFPVNAHTTASDALRMGVPLVTLAGETMISRVAGSLLHDLGLDELIATDVAGYEERVVQLALQPARLKELRQRLETLVEDHPLFSGVAFARKLEAALHRTVNDPSHRG
jgi:protein O-GlcNAc transferase